VSGDIATRCPGFRYVAHITASPMTNPEIPDGPTVNARQRVASGAPRLPKHGAESFDMGFERSSAMSFGEAT